MSIEILKNGQKVELNSSKERRILNIINEEEIVMNQIKEVELGNVNVNETVILDGTEFIVMKKDNEKVTLIVKNAIDGTFSSPKNNSTNYEISNANSVCRDLFNKLNPESFADLMFPINIDLTTSENEKVEGNESFEGFAVLPTINMVKENEEFFKTLPNDHGIVLANAFSSNSNRIAVYSNGSIIFKPTFYTFHIYPIIQVNSSVYVQQTVNN